MRRALLPYFQKMDMPPYMQEKHILVPTEVPARIRNCMGFKLILGVQQQANPLAIQECKILEIKQMGHLTISEPYRISIAFGEKIFT